MARRREGRGREREEREGNNLEQGRRLAKAGPVKRFD